MGDAVVEPERNQNLRFFCHRCNVEFEDVIQAYFLQKEAEIEYLALKIALKPVLSESNKEKNDTCPYCASGFIERIDTNYRDTLRSLVESEYSDAEMSNLDDAGGLDDSALDESLDESNTNFHEIPPMLNDLAFLMSGGRTRPGGVRTPRTETLMEQLVWMIGGGRGGTGAVTAGAPFVLVGAPGDYVFGGEGLDAVVTQLLGQLENTGPPPLPTEQISTIPSDLITAAQVEANMSCSVCWDAFTLGESVSRLECTHIFHPACITPWLQLHATCPICRHNLMPPAPVTPQSPAPQTPYPESQPASGNNTATSPSLPRQRVHRLRRRAPTADSSSSSSGTGVGGIWAHLASSISSNLLANADSSSSLNSSDTNRFMDIDFD